MKLLDRLLRIPSDEVAPGKFRYEARRIGGVLTALGALAIVGGAVAGSLGFEAAGEAVAGGMVAATLGSTALIGSMIPGNHEM